MFLEMKRSTQVGIAIIAAALFVLIGLSRASWQQEPDIQLFAAVDCRDSCWHGLRPGETSLAEVVQELSSAPFEILDSQTTSNNIGLIIAKYGSNYRINAIVQNNTLRLLTIGGMRLNMVAGDVVSLLGEPEYVTFWGGPAQTANEIQAFMIWYFPQRGFAFLFFDSPGLSGHLIQYGTEICSSAEAVVTRVEITEAGSIEDMLVDLALPTGDRGMPRDRLTEWAGFGCFTLRQ